MTSGPGASGEPAADYTVDELMVARIADCLGNDDQVANGLASFIPVCAIQLARLTHAPDLTWIPGGSGVDPEEPLLTASTFEWPLWRDSVMYLELYGEFWDYVSSGRFFRTFCLGAAQIDAYGNANNSVIGTFGRPRVRLPGTAGLADMSTLVGSADQAGARSRVPWPATGTGNPFILDLVCLLAGDVHRAERIL